jgi:ribonuclease-3
MNKIYKFKNESLDQVWKTHPSYEENPEFQRMEFLGDKIIAYCLSEHLVSQVPKLSEGQLSLNLENMINKNALSKLADFLAEDILYKDSLNDKILADCLEAWIGCVFLDGGDIKSIIETLWKDSLQTNFKKNPKNELQELLQSKKQSPIYIYQSKGKDFTVQLKINNLEVSATASSKKEASKKAAQMMIQQLSIELSNSQEDSDPEDFFKKTTYRTSNSRPLSSRTRTRESNFDSNTSSSEEQDGARRFRRDFSENVDGNASSPESQDGARRFRQRDFSESPERNRNDQYGRSSDRNQRNGRGFSSRPAPRFGARSPRSMDGGRSPRSMDSARSPRSMDGARSSRPMDGGRSSRTMDGGRSSRPMERSQSRSSDGMRRSSRFSREDNFVRNDNRGSRFTNTQRTFRSSRFAGEASAKFDDQSSNESRGARFESSQLTEETITSKERPRFSRNTQRPSSSRFSRTTSSSPRSRERSERPLRFTTSRVRKEIENPEVESSSKTSTSKRSSKKEKDSSTTSSKDSE